MNRRWCTLIGIGYAVGALAADPSAPAEFRIGNTIVQPDPWLFTATIGKVPGNTIAYGAFEPFRFGHKWELKGDAENELLVGEEDWKAYRLVKDGFWDGASVRVYRVRNGAFVKVRDDHIAEGGHCSSGWDELRLGRGGLVLLDPSANTATYGVGGWRLDVPYWFRLRAVAKDGRMSPPSKAASVTPTASAGKKAPKPTTVTLKDVALGEEDVALTSPGDFAADTDDTGIITFRWESDGDPDAAGYALEITDTDPAKHRGFHLRLEGRAGEDGQEALKANDLAFISKEFTDYTRKRYVRHTGFSGRGYGDLMSSKPCTYSSPREFGDEVPGMRWTLVKHPQPVPDAFAPETGVTCMRLELDDGMTQDILVARQGRSNQDWYPVLKANADYIMEAWIRAESPGAEATFQYSSGADPLVLKPTTDWERHTVTFNTGAPDSLVVNSIESMTLTFSGPGTFWIDNVRMYPKEEGFLQPRPKAVEEARKAGLHAIRFHSHIKTPQGYSMDVLTNPRGVVTRAGARDGMNSDTLPALLDFVRKVDSNPWLQIEMCMSEDEWLGLIEWMAAPYDPEKDTPEAKPWAYKRYAQGQQKPWADEFEKIYFEISNETWNWSFDPWIFYPGHVDDATGEAVPRGRLCGYLNEYVLMVMRTSPYWTRELEAKWVSVLGGWRSDQSDKLGYGPQAVLGGKGINHLTVANYNGGWDEGEKTTEASDASFFRSASWTPQYDESLIAPLRLRDRQVAEGLRGDYAFGIYEAGPGYAFPMTRGQDEVGKSLATGIATLDGFVRKAELGYQLQNFFTFNFRHNGWTSHAPERFGGHAYPSWKGLVLFNHEGHGDFLGVETASVPTADLEKFAKRQERKDAPLVACYATARGDRVNVLLISRKVDGVLAGNEDGWTPVTVKLPFARATSVTLHMLTGDPRWHNLDEEKVEVQTRADIPFGGAEFALTRGVTGLERDDLPPASALLFVFEGTDLRSNRRPEVTVESPLLASVGVAVQLKARATDPDGDRPNLTWELGTAGTWDEAAGEATFTRSGRHEVWVVADDQNGGVRRRLCIVDASLVYAGSRWSMSDLEEQTSDLNPAEIAGSAFILPARGSFREYPWFYSQDAAVAEKGSVRIRIAEGGSDRGELLAGLSLRGTADDWKPYRTAHVSLLIASDRGSPDQSTICFDDLRGPGANAVASAKGWKLPVWLRIDRDGDKYTGFASADGQDWTQIGVIDGPRRNMGRKVFAGIATGTGGRSAGTVTVDNLSIQ